MTQSNESARISSPESSLELLAGVGPQRVEALARIGIRNFHDLLRHFPRRYEDRRNLLPISSVEEGSTVVLSGQLRSVEARSLGVGRHLLTARLADASGAIELVWFNRAYLAEWLRIGLVICVCGAVKRRRGKLQISAPDFEVDHGEDASGAQLHMNRIVPIYPLTRGVQQRFLRGLVATVLAALEEIQRDSSDGSIFASTPYDHFHPQGLDELAAFASIHFPADDADAARARERFAFDERFAFASRLAFRRQSFRGDAGPSFEVSAELDEKIRSIFPFELTAEQDRVVDEIVRDLRGPAPMYRLLQGDVGTGKTAVALYALLAAVRGGYQGAMLAPTEVLARQHLTTLRGYLSDHPALRVELLVGATSASERRGILEGLAAGSVHLVVGTQALVQESVTMSRLGLIVIDEQHRFGVHERRKIREKGENPHLLVMTATPIPRSLSMTCYGDLDLSILRERPPGREPVTTRRVTARTRAKALSFVLEQLRAGRQAYFVYPLVEESENLALPAAVEGHAALSKGPFAEFSVGLLHGRMDPAEKTRELDRFRRGETRVLVATVVVEVGIDVPQATVIWLEDGSRFGLAQLHQLRGRVGRGGHRGYCFVSAEGAGKDAMERLRIFERIDDGFELAQEDLRRRGPGDYLGVRQAGKPREGLGHPLDDLDAFLEVRSLAESFWEREENQHFRQRWRAAIEAFGDAASGQFLGAD